MTVRAEATRLVPATSREGLQFVLDLDRCRKTDTKIGRVTRPVVDFTARSICTDVDEGCRLTHGYELTIRRPIRWVYEPLLRTWLPSELDSDDSLARLGTFHRPVHARLVRAFGTDLTTVRIDSSATVA